MEDRAQTQNNTPLLVVKLVGGFFIILLILLAFAVIFSQRQIKEMKRAEQLERQEKAQQERKKMPVLTPGVISYMKDARIAPTRCYAVYPYFPNQSKTTTFGLTFAQVACDGIPEELFLERKP